MPRPINLRLMRPRYLAQLGVLVLLLLPLCLTASDSHVVLAATITVNATCSLPNAIAAANTDAPVQGCAGGSGADTIRLEAGATYTLHNAASTGDTGRSGLPPVTSDITIEGNGATIKRSSATSTPSFRLFHVTAPGRLTLEDVMLGHGHAQGDTALTGSGGAILNEGRLTLRRSTLFGNRAVGAAASGGAIANEGGTVILTNSTFSDNAALGGAGGLLQPREGEQARGGALFNRNGTVTIHNSTFYNNRVQTDTQQDGQAAGSGIYNLGAGRGNQASLTIHNSIVAADDGSLVCVNATADDATTTLEGSHNLMRFSADCPGITLTDDPRLSPLRANGGATWTHALRPDSPAINAGHPAGCLDVGGTLLLTDQRDIARPQSGRCDIGAVERFPVSLTPIADQTIAEDTTLDNIVFRVRADVDMLIIGQPSARSSNTLLVPNSNIVLSGSGSERTVRITPVLNQSGTTTITVRLVAETSFPLTVTAVADTPMLTVTDTVGYVYAALPLNIQAALADSDGSEQLGVRILGLPAGARLSAGTANGQGEWTLTSDQLAGLTLTPPPGSDADFTLTIRATATEQANENSVTIERPLRVVVERPTLFLPLVIMPKPRKPDLVASFSLSPDKDVFTAGEPVTITAIITNVGTAATTGGFWVDLFINPNEPPTPERIPMTWNQTCSLTPCYGLAWWLGPRLEPGASRILTSTLDSYDPTYTRWEEQFAPGTTDLYLYVDAWGAVGNPGAEAEQDETNNRAERHGLRVLDNGQSTVDNGEWGMENAAGRLNQAHEMGRGHAELPPRPLPRK